MRKAACCHVAFYVCPGWDLNPYRIFPHGPQPCVSTKFHHLGVFGKTEDIEETGDSSPAIVTNYNSTS